MKKFILRTICTYRKNAKINTRVIPARNKREARERVERGQRLLMIEPYQGKAANQYKKSCEGGE